MYLPASSKPIEEKKEAEMITIKGNESILIIDDEEVIRDVVKEGLGDLGYTVFTAKNGLEGIAIYSGQKGNIDLVILDLILPKMSGTITYEKLKALDPQVTVLLSSGYSQKGQAQELLDRGVQGFIQKPFRLIDLAKAIRMLLAREKAH
jgi:CheY-like chemotaxis protein